MLKKYFFRFLVFGIILFVTLINDLPATELAEGSVVYIWNFKPKGDSEDDLLMQSLAQQLTMEFEEKLVQIAYFTVIDRRERNLISQQRELEKTIRTIQDLSPKEINNLQEAKADAIVWGEIFDDVISGEFKVSVTVQAFNAQILKKESVRFSRGKVFDAESRELNMEKLAKKLCSLESTQVEEPELRKFYNIWYSEKEYGVSDMRDISGGILSVGRNMAIYSRDEEIVRITNIKKVSHVKMSGDINKGWVKVNYELDGENLVAYFADGTKGNFVTLLGGSFEILDALSKCIEKPEGSGE